MEHQLSSSNARWARIQAVSGLGFALFLVPHLLNAMVAPLGPGTYDGLQRVLRLYYRFPLVEIVGVLGALVVHMVAGVVRIRARPRGGKPALRIRLHRYAAYFLLVFAFGHFAATRLPSIFYGVELGFAGLSYSLARFPGYFYPYYVLLGAAGVYHGLHGISVALAQLGVRLPETLRRGRAFVAVSGLGAAAILVAILAFGGDLFAIADPFDNDFARLGERLLGLL